MNESFFTQMSGCANNTVDEENFFKNISLKYCMNAFSFIIQILCQIFVMNLMEIILFFHKENLRKLKITT